MMREYLHALARGGGLLLALLSLAPLRAEQWPVAPELWDRPRSARAVLDQAVIRGAIRQHLEHPGSRIVIHHGYGQMPLLQAEELRAWLMALAVDAVQLNLRNDVRPDEALKIEVMK